MTALFIAAREQAMPYLPLLHTAEVVHRWMDVVVIASGRPQVAMHGEHLLGFVSGNRTHLEHLYVIPDAQGQAVGSRLLDVAKGSSSGRLVLHVFQRNTRARAFYERHGFQLLMLCDGTENEEGEPDAVYKWTAVN